MVEKIPLNEISPIMQSFRNYLDEHDIPWLDMSEKIADTSFSDFRFERTKVYSSKNGDGWKLSVIYVYDSKMPDCIAGYSYGYPDCLEVWCPDWDEDPQPYKLNELLEMIAVYDKDKNDA